MQRAANLRIQIEQMLEARVPSALTPKVKEIQECISCGISEMDRMEVFRRGALVEVCGPSSTGRTTLLHGLLSRCTAAGEAAALIDVTDSFDPVSASGNGVALSEVLWVRCGAVAKQGRPLSALEQAFGAVELLLQSGGFGLLALDLANVAPKDARRVPLSTWFKFRRAVESTRTLFLVLTQQSNAGSGSASEIDLFQSDIGIDASGIGKHVDGDCLIRTLHVRAEVARGHMRKPVRSIRAFGEFSASLYSYR